jgi:hypothetical protein
MVFSDLAIPPEQLNDHGVYLLKARNAAVGVWLPDEQAFLIARVKAGCTFTTKEYHWAEGAPFGTAIPLKALDERLTSYEGKVCTIRLHALSQQYRGEISDFLIAAMDKANALNPTRQSRRAKTPAPITRR